MSLHGFRRSSVRRRIVSLFPFVAALLLFPTFMLSFRRMDQFPYGTLTLAGCNNSNMRNSGSKHETTGSGSSQAAVLSMQTLRLPSVCSDGSCVPDYARHLQIENSFVIPAIRHILWKNESVSQYFAEQLRTWQRIHPDWTYVLWRDQDLEPFVAAHFPGLLAKFKSLPYHIMRVDMIRYMLLSKYGGTYADLDYSLVRSLDEFRRFSAVVTREPEAHSLDFLGMTWPVKPLANPAFLMAAPCHTFFRFSLQQLKSREANNILKFAGPLGLTDILHEYQRLVPIANHPIETVYVPPSFSFYPYPNNRLNNSKSEYLPGRFASLQFYCKSLSHNPIELIKQLLGTDSQLSRFCADVNNLDRITDKSQPVFAIHDLQKPIAAYDDGVSINIYYEKLVDMRRIINGLKFGKVFMMTG